MFKSLAAIAVVCLAVLVIARAGPLSEAPLVKRGMLEAFKRGMQRFAQGEQVVESLPTGLNKPVDKPVGKPQKPKILSHYTANMKSLDGGIPKLRDQYRHHNFTPLTPSVVPVEFPPMPNGQMSPEAAARMFKPQPPLQFTYDY